MNARSTEEPSSQEVHMPKTVQQMSPAERLAKAKPPKKPRVRTWTAIWECRLQQVRESLNLTIRDVAKGTGLASNTLWQIEQGRETSLSTAYKLAAFFGRPVSELWPERKS